MMKSILRNLSIRSPRKMFGKKIRNTSMSSKSMKSSNISPSVDEFDKMMNLGKSKMPKKSMFRKRR